MGHLVPSSSFPYSNREKILEHFPEHFPERGSKILHITLTSGFCLYRSGTYEYTKFPSPEQYISFSYSLPFTHPNQHVQFM